MRVFTIDSLGVIVCLWERSHRISALQTRKGAEAAHPAHAPDPAPIPDTASHRATRPPAGPRAHDDRAFAVRPLPPFAPSTTATGRWHHAPARHPIAQPPATPRPDRGPGRP